MPTIGKYEILEQLGSGSMGTVYRGRDTLLDRMVAIKTIRTGINIELEAKERFYREARTCARLNHPHIVSVYDLGEENGTSFIAMELLAGSDFRQLIERKEALPLPLKLTAMAQVCEALAHAHREGIIHRDMKPSNLFMLADGRAKVVDFGIAKLPTSHLTRAGAILGTPNYMAPEQINGSTCDGRADLFSAAVVFFEFLTFQHPFKSNLIPRRILEDNPDSLLQLDPSLPRILEKIFARALAKDPAQRYATGDEFASDLRAVIDAIAMNASPTFSRVELPSQSSFGVPPPIPTPEQHTFSGTSGTSSQEWRGSRMLKLLPLFDEQIRVNDRAAARSTLAEMQSVAGSDPRYREALESCRARVTDGNITQIRTGVSQSCPKCGTANKPDAMFCIGCGTGIAPGSGTGTQAKPATTAPPPPPPLSAAPPPKAIAAKPAGINTDKAIHDKKRLFLVIGILALAAVLLIVGPMLFRSVKAEPFVATARVAAQQGHILETASERAKNIATVDRGSQVNVLALPKSLSQDWVRVQAHTGDTYTRAGFLKASALTEWDSRDPDKALALARMSGPMDQGTDAEIRAQIDRLTSVAAAFSGKPASNAAAFDAARLEFLLAKHARELSPAGGDWQTSLADLSSRLEGLRRDPALQSGIDSLLKQIHEVMPETSPVTGTPGQVPPVTQPAQTTAGQTTAGQPGASGGTPVPATLTDAEVKYWMNAAQQGLKEARYTDALRAVGRVLNAQPKNSDAKALQTKIKDQVEFERSLR